MLKTAFFCDIYGYCRKPISPQQVLGTRCITNYYVYWIIEYSFNKQSDYILILKSKHVCNFYLEFQNQRSNWQTSKLKCFELSFIKFMMPKHTSQWAKHRLGFKREYQGGWKKALQEWKYSIHVKCFPFSNFSSYLVHCHLNLFLFINSSSNHFGLCLWWFLVATAVLTTLWRSPQVVVYIIPTLSQWSASNTSNSKIIQVQI